MKNHFFFPYFGNKRTECERLFELMNFEDITTFIEPFCGSCAVSYYIWTKKPNMKFILNDNNKYLKELYDICQDDKKIDDFNNLYNSKIHENISKEEYNEIVKEKNLLGYFVGSKMFSIRCGIYPIRDLKRKSFYNIDLRKHDIYNFYKNANIDFFCTEAIELIKSNQYNKNCIIFLDPPYISTCNDFYMDHNMNVYEWLYNNDIMNFEAFVYCIFEDIWIIKLLFSKCFKTIYDKKYQTTKKKTSHCIISNKIL
jgi:site-specific DNA-adenine methylase